MIGDVGSAASIVVAGKPREIIWYAAGFGTLEMLLAVMPNYTTYSIMLVLCGFAAISTMLSSNTYVQLSTKANLRGRVMGIYFLVFLGGTPFGAPMIGWSSDLIGVRETLAICGFITGVGGLISYYFLRQRLAAFEEHQRANSN